ncbi:SDR family NAD(P)-dependent oxidoreductase [Neorhizobium sp. DAR64860/K0K1]|uniref:SDR family NAD(P)-dependent oxidoreductase n=1 Tax=Neorhizobium sp. DAR64860/K0K1 TaxID=3421955 RepID=UPI003D27F6C5
MARQTALITGANKGIGFAIARQLAERGFLVWLGCRDEKRGELAAQMLRDLGHDAQSIVLNVVDDGSVCAAAEKIGREVTSLDVLVNNAGMHFGYPPPASEEPIDQMRAMLDVNALGPVRVTQAFLPLLREAERARIVMMSSGLGSIEGTADMTSENWTVGFAGYCASKAALNMFMLKLAKDLMNEGIKVNAADPGLTATDLTGHMGERTPTQAAAIAVQLATLDALGPTGGFFHDGTSSTLVRHPW